MSEAQEIAPRPGVTVVTAENFDAYVATQLPAREVDVSDADIIEETPETKAAAELKEVEAEKAERLAKEQPEEIDHPDKDKKGKLNERFSELTKARKEAEAKAEKAAAEAKTAREEREAIQRERDELRQKYEPPKSDEIGPEPQLADYAGDTSKYSADLKEWTSNKVRVEDKQAAAQQQAQREAEATAKAWKDRQEAYRKTNPDYDAKIEASDVKVSDQVQQAILESDVGPQLLEYLADNSEFAVDLGKLTVAKALREIGKLEAKLSGEAKPGATKAIAEISRAPAPITPIKNANSPVVRLAGHNEVPKEMNYEQWKKLRESGKIA